MRVNRKKKGSKRHVNLILSDFVSNIKLIFIQFDASVRCEGFPKVQIILNNSNHKFTVYLITETKKSSIWWLPMSSPCSLGMFAPLTMLPREIYHRTLGRDYKRHGNLTRMAQALRVLAPFVVQFHLHFFIESLRSRRWYHLNEMVCF